MTCDRCGRETGAYTMSMFNTDTICMDCKRREKAHPSYAKAEEADQDEIRNGNFNFPGIGCPPDLLGGGTDA